METLSFTFGILTMIAVIALLAIVIGIMKVVKLQTQISNLEIAFENFERSFSAQINDVYRSQHDQMSEVYREIDRRSENLYTDSRSYTDARIDKLGTKIKTEKQLLKEY